MDVVSGRVTFRIKRGVAAGLIVARSSFVDVVLNDGSVHHGKGGDPETSGDTVDWREVDLGLAEGGEHEVVHNGQEDDNSDGIEVLHEIVGDAMAGHLTGLTDEVVAEVAVNDPVDRVEAEDLAGNEGTLDFLNKVIIPSQSDAVTHGGLVRWFCGIHFAVLNHHSDNAEAVRDDASLGRAHNVDLLSKNEGERADQEHAEAEQEGSPKVDIAFHVRGGQQRQTAKVDAEVEDHIDALDGNGGIDNDALASLFVGLHNHLTTPVLIGNKGCHVRFDTTGSETDD